MGPDAVVEMLSEFLKAEVRVEAPYRLHVRPGRELHRAWTGVSEDRRLFTPGFLIDREHPAVQAAADAIRDSTGRTPAIRPWTFATDGGHTCGVHGIPTIGYAPGEERHAHTNEERLSLDAARTAFRAYPFLVEAVMGVG
jgi:acetylornithine deacetylase/succinyl-diaminopimelate desuccinylase-like protein